MSNHHLQDKRLSLKAKGLLSYMLSLPDDWDYSLKGLTVGCKDGLDSVRTAVLELEEHGYVRRQKVRNAKGQIIDYDYQVYESPVEDAPAVPGKEGEPSDPSASKSLKSRMKPCSSPFLDFPNLAEPNLEKATQTSVYKGYKRDKIEMRGDRAEMSDFPLYLNTVAGGLDRRDQTIGGFSFVVKIYALPVVEIIGQLLYLLGRYGFNAQFGDCL